MTISLSAFKDLSEKDKKKTLETLKKDIGVGGMVKEWDISRSKVYSMLHQYDIAVSSKHKVKPQKPRKTSINPAETGNSEISSAAAPTAPSKFMEPVQTDLGSSSLDFTEKDDAAKFSLYLETQGTASFINETVQLLLGSQKFAGSNLQVNISLQEL